MNRYCIQHHSRTLAALARREEQQTLPLPAWGFNFSNHGLRIALSDSVKQATEINLHTGLSIIVDLKANSVEEAIGTSENFAETLLNLISFSTLAYCDSARLASIINIADGESYPFRHHVYPFDGQEIIGSLSIIEETLFRAIFEAYNENPYQQRTLRALTWLRRGIGEENTVDEFISYWIGLEVIKHILSPAQKRNASEEWEDVKDTFSNKLHFENFNTIKETGRNGLLHGFRELNNAFVKEIKSYLEPLRKTLIFCIGSVLCLEDKVITTIANKTPRRIRLNPWAVIEGNLKNISRDFNELARNYPMIDAEIANKKFSIDQRGNLNMRLTVNHHFHGSSDTKWEIKATELWSDKDAGIGHGDIK